MTRRRRRHAEPLRRYHARLVLQAIAGFGLAIALIDAWALVGGHR